MARFRCRPAVCTRGVCPGARAGRFAERGTAAAVRASVARHDRARRSGVARGAALDLDAGAGDRKEAERREDRCRSEEHTSELQSLMRISYAVFCLKKKNISTKYNPH